MFSKNFIRTRNKHHVPRPLPPFVFPEKYTLCWHQNIQHCAMITS